MNKRILSVIGVSVLMPACGMIKNLNDMHKSTVGMAKTTGGMASTTSHMANTTDGMAETTNHMSETTDGLSAMTEAMYADLRQGNSLTIRTERLRTMEHLSSQAAKISEAAKFEMAFEFQLWKAFGADTEEKRQALYVDAIPEFFRSMAEYVEHKHPLMPVFMNNNIKNLYALAAGLHRVNPNQTAMLADSPDVEEVHMLKLIKDGLSAKARVVSGEVAPGDLPEYQQEVLKEEANATYILQLRHQFLIGMALAKVADFDSKSEVGQFFFKAWHMLVKWNADFSDLNEVQIKEYAKWLREAVKTQSFLASVGVTDRLDKKLRKVLTKMQISLPADQTKWGHREEQIADFKAAVQEVLQAP
jgi:hypothetical protein